MNGRNIQRDDGLSAVEQRDCIKMLKNTHGRLTNTAQSLDAINKLGMKLHRISREHIEKDVLLESCLDLMVDRG